MRMPKKISTDIHSGIKLGDAMTPHVISVRPSATVLECAKMMLGHKIGSLIVTDSKQRPLGILTERDIVRKGIVDDVKPSMLKAEDVMETGLVTASPGDDIMDALRLMRDEDIRHLPVVHQEKIVGMVTVKDLLGIQPELFDLWSEHYAIERKPR